MRISLIFNILFLVSAGYVLVDLHKSMKERQEIVTDLAVANDIRYGLFNVDKWKNIVADAISQKINELSLDNNLHESLRKPVESALYKMIDNIENYLKQEKESGNWLQKAVKTVAYDIAFDAEKFRKQVPEWTDDVIKQINTLENRNQMKKYLKDKLDDFFNETTAIHHYDVYSYVTNKYGIESYEECVITLSDKSQALSSHSWRLSWILISIVVMMFVTYFAIKPIDRSELHYYTLMLGVMILLLGGILTPMIDIDARISNLEFLFLGETVQFKDQVIFFQSKSVFDVVMLLIKEGDAQTIGVGILIFTFSIIFPTLKFLFSTLAYRFPKWIKENRILRFFVLESAKWSMADVMVLAIFMSYIGFSSIVGAQLDFVSGCDNAGILSTHEHTILQMGFFIFTAYCICGIVFGYVAKKILLSESKK